MRRRNQGKKIKVTVDISPELHRKINKAIKLGYAVSISEFVRDSLKERIRRIEEKIGEEL